MTGLRVTKIVNKIKFEGIIDELEAIFPETIIHKIFETNSNFPCKASVFQEFLLVLKKNSFWQEDWTLAYHCMRV